MENPTSKQGNETKIISAAKVKSALLQVNRLLSSEKIALDDAKSSSIGEKQLLIKDSILETERRPSTEVAKKPSWRPQICALVPVYLLQLCYGMNSAFPAILVPQLLEPCSEFAINLSDASLIVSLENFATPVMCLVSGYLQMKFGPKNVLLFACFPYFFGWLLAAAATSLQFIFMSRVLVGVSHALLATSIYTVEISSKELRGSLSVLEGVLRCSGSLIMFLFGACGLRWHQMALLAPLIPFSALIAVTNSPESPVHLVAKGRAEEAETVLRRLQGYQKHVQEEAQIIKDNLAELKARRDQQEKKKSSVLRNVCGHPEVYKPFGIIILLSVIQQFSGVSVLRAYVVTIFESVFHPKGVTFDQSNIVSNFTTDVDCSSSERTSFKSYSAAILIAVVRLGSCLMASRLLMKYKRRSMYLFSLSTTSLSLAFFAGSSYLVHTEVLVPLTRWISLIAACLIVFSAQFGIQNLPFLLSGELFSADVRALCKSLARSLTCLLLVISLMSYPLLQSSLELHGTFLMLSITLVPFIPLVYWILPETKDVGLELIQRYFLPYKTIFYVDIATNNENNK